MKFFLEKVDNLLKESGKSQSKFFEDSGLSKGNYAHWKKSSAKLEQLQQLANFYGKSVLSFYDLNDLDAEFITSNWQDVLNLLVKSEIEENGTILDDESLEAPYVGDAAANPKGKDNPVDLEYDLGEYGQHNMQTMKRFYDPNGVWVRVDGDSMEPTLHDGEYVYVSPNRQIEPGRICFFRVNDKTLIKRYIKIEDKIVLKSDNPKYKSITITAKDDLQQSGLVVQAARVLN
jgi:phage repressor protein C with HTH and peptisase S24 domain